MMFLCATASPYECESNLPILQQCLSISYHAPLLHVELVWWELSTNEPQLYLLLSKNNIDYDRIQVSINSLSLQIQRQVAHK